MKHLTLLFIIICTLAISIISDNALEAAAGNLYKVGINDLISIKVLDHPELLTTATVGNDGTITFPYIGTIHVKDMTLSDIEKVITEKLSEGFVKYPVVSVSLIRSVQNIFSYGEVNRQGEIPYDENMTLEEAMSMAGGVTGNGLFGKVIVRRKQKGSYKYKDLVEADLNNGLIENRNKADVLLKPDDLLIVKKSNTFLIQGEVVNRGRTVLEKDMTVGKALLQAGGITNEGLYGKVKVRRRQEDAKGNYKDIAESNMNDGAIESSEVEDMSLQPDDILVVERSKTFLIQGEVVNRGRFKLEKDMTVVKALLQAGGITNEGLYGKVKVKRKQEGELGGYKEILDSKLNNGVIESKEVEETMIQPDDILLVEKNDTYFIYGEVNKTGEYVLKDNMTVFKAITVAGGFTKWGSGSRVKLLRLVNNGKKFETIDVNINKVIDGDVAADVDLQSGDIIIASASIL